MVELGASFVTNYESYKFEQHQAEPLRLSSLAMSPHHNTPTFHPIAKCRISSTGDCPCTSACCDLLSISHITVHGMQQISQEPPSGQGHSTHPVFGPAGFWMEEVELLLEVGRTAFTGSRIAETAIARTRQYVCRICVEGNIVGRGEAGC